ncbi:thioredoxin-disulfide reductase [Actinomycetospora cinnamomea]|uniref:Thioredoxin reductase n=1 Tax=Actinomycetospora cinnamomea TaxID=663609 RepID=A0A2U1FFB4_9PSEU|nr:thioredoxin-disulfide reductase [Actinomycetospora cinnamomea]PVZ10905.1 thioredoxin reductase (NADPH) [Actinomycetospora cinnamomea]
MSDQTIHDVIIVGSGPAGYTAAVYSSRAQLDVLVFEGSQFGGALMTTTGVENYPGFADEIQGPELMDRMRRQAERFGAVLRPEDVESVDLRGDVKSVHVNGTDHFARAIILAMGAQARYLGVPGEERLLGRGVSACATCDGFFFRDHDIVVVGGGDSAMEEATFLTRFARSVTILHRRSEFRASGIMLERARQDPKITIRTDTVVEEVLGDTTVEGVRVRNTVTGEEETLAVTGMFVAVGHDPRSALVRDVVDTDDEGYVRVALPGTGTNVPGVFACGDLVDHTYRQAVTAAGSGCQASIDAERWLAEQPAAPHRDTAPPPTPGVDGAEVDELDSIHARAGGPVAGDGRAAGGSVDEGSPEPAGDAVPAPS